MLCAFLQKSCHASFISIHNPCGNPGVREEREVGMGWGGSSQHVGKRVECGGGGGGGG